MSNRCENCIECYKTTEEQVEQLQTENERLLMANKTYAIQQELYEHKNTEIQNLIAENERIKAKNVDLEDALALAHTELTSIPDWPDTEHEHFVSETIEQALARQERK